MASSTKSSTKKIIKWLIITLVVLALGWFLYNQFKPEEIAPSYITATAHIGDIENNVMASGKVKAINTVNVGAQVSGEVTKLYVEVGDEVQQGDLIAQIDQVTQQNNLSNQQALLEQSRASLQSAQADYLSQQASLQSAEANLISRQSELRQAQADLARLQPLVAMQAISKQEAELAQTSVDTAQAAVTNAQAAVKIAQSGLITAQANITSSKANLQMAQTNLDTATTDLGYTTIRAPINGTVVAVVTEQGTTVNANQSAPTIVTLADLSTVRINAQISEADVVYVEPGMPVYFNTIGNPDEEYHAVLTAIEPAPEQISSSSATDAAVYYIGYIEVPNPDRKFRIDMTTQVYIVVDSATDTLLVPSPAIKDGIPPRSHPVLVQGGTDTSDSELSDNPDMPDVSASTVPTTTVSSENNRHYVRVLNEDNSVDNRPVEVGIDNRVNAQILSGLSAGEAVIIGEDSGGQSSGGGMPPPRL